MFPPLDYSSFLSLCAKPLQFVLLSVTPWTVAHQLLCPWDSPGKNTGVGCRALLQGIFPTQGWNTCLLHLSLMSLALANFSWFLSHQLLV